MKTQYNTYRIEYNPSDKTNALVYIQAIAGYEVCVMLTDIVCNIRHDEYDSIYTDDWFISYNVDGVTLDGEDCPSMLPVIDKLDDRLKQLILATY